MDPHIRSWTQYDERRAKVVAVIDKKRLSFCEASCCGGVFNERCLSLRAQSLYRYVLGEQFIPVRVEGSAAPEDASAR